MNADTVLMFADGASRGNPGLASYGVVFKTIEGERLFELAKSIGVETNNVAEYSALLEGLRFAIEKKILAIAVFLDSQLVVKQVLGLYRVRQDHLKPYHQKILQLISQFHSFSIKHIPRQENKEADLLANRALDCRV